MTDGDPRVVGASIVAWTTTPWTLTSNLGLAVDGRRALRPRPRAGPRAGPRRRRGRAWTTSPGPPAATPEVGRARSPVRDLVGRALRAAVPERRRTPTTHRVVAADFVVMNEGTGIVHIAPGFGADDLATGRREGWPPFTPIDDAGEVHRRGAGVRARAVREGRRPAAHRRTSAARGLLVAAEDYEHTYPLCWRCDTPLLYVARTSWYVRTTALKDQLLEENAGTNWYPGHIRTAATATGWRTTSTGRSPASGTGARRSRSGCAARDHRRSPSARWPSCRSWPGGTSPARSAPARTSTR